MQFDDAGAQDNPKSPEYNPFEEEEDKENVKQYNTQDYPLFMETLMRFASVSNNAAACLANALLMDLHILDASTALNAEKIRRQREKKGKDLVEKHLQDNRGVIAVGVDSKRSKTAKLKGQEKLRDLHTMIDSAEGTHLDVFETPKGTGVAVAAGGYQVLVKFNIAGIVVVINSDGCSVMTGIDNGAIRHLECFLGRPLQWSICLLHCLELIFRNLFVCVGKFVDTLDLFNLDCTKRQRIGF